MIESQVENILKSSLEEINESANTKVKLELGASAPVFGREAPLTSLELVSLLVILEQNLEDTFNKSISLSNDRAMSQKSSPFRTFGSLRDYIVQVLNEK